MAKNLKNRFCGGVSGISQFSLRRYRFLPKRRAKRPLAGVLARRANGPRPTSISLPVVTVHGATVILIAAKDLGSAATSREILRCAQDDGLYGRVNGCRPVTQRMRF